MANDILPLALESTRLNVMANGGESGSGGGGGGSIDYISDNIVGTDVHALIEGEGRIDVCVAGDVLYDDELARAVFPWFVEMAQSGTEVLVGDPGRWVLQEGKYNDLIEKVEDYALDEKVAKEHHGLVTGNVWRVKG